MRPERFRCLSRETFPGRELSSTVDPPGLSASLTGSTKPQPGQGVPLRRAWNPHLAVSAACQQADKVH